MMLNCFKCNKEFSSAVKDSDNENCPYGATVFTSQGQYGSTVWDEPPFSSRFLEINICDDCLVNGDVLLVDTIREYKTSRVLWEGERA